MCFPVHPVAELGNCLLKKKPGGMPLFSILKRRRWRRPSLLPMVRPERALKCLRVRETIKSSALPTRLYGVIPVAVEFRRSECKGGHLHVRDFDSGFVFGFIYRGFNDQAFVCGG